jgi:periodic tryptophan protein 1
MEDATAAAAAMAKSVKNPSAGADDDLSAYNLDDYDEEESKGAGESE